MAMPSPSLRIASIILVTLVGGCSRGPSETRTTQTGDDYKPATRQPATVSYADAAKEVLGPSAVVLRHGDLSDSGAAEAIAILEIKSVPRRQHCVAVTRMVVLRATAAGWKTVL